MHLATHANSWTMRRSPHGIAPDVVLQPITGFGGGYVLTNCYCVGPPDNWIMVDTGVPDTEGRTLETTRRLYGNQPAKAIVLTHAHFDHYGSAAALSDAWGAPIYIHPFDMPYVSGRDTLPPYDPTVGGFVSQLSRMFPLSGTDLGSRVRALPMDGTVPHATDWRWLHTPGHTPGHISLFRESDRTLLAGDALITVDQDSAVDAILVRRSLHGPSTFATYDWPAARASVEQLARLRPVTIATGHGEPMSGAEVPRQLEMLANQFGGRAVPSHGRYVRQPIAVDESGVRYIPDKPFDPFPVVAGAIGMAAAAGVLAALRKGSDRTRSPRSP